MIVNRNVPKDISGQETAKEPFTSDAVSRRASRRLSQNLILQEQQRRIIEQVFFFSPFSTLYFHSLKFLLNYFIRMRIRRRKRKKGRKTKLVQIVWLKEKDCGEKIHFGGGLN